MKHLCAVLCRTIIMSIMDKKAGRMQQKTAARWGRTNEGLPQTPGSLLQYIHRTNYQILMWRKALVVPKRDLPAPEEHGALQPVLMAKEPTPCSLIASTASHCKKSSCLQKASVCMTLESCHILNSHTLAVECSRCIEPRICWKWWPCL